jgi:OTU domain-containing protein 3
MPRKSKKNKRNKKKSDQHNADREWKRNNRKKRGKQAQYNQQLRLFNEQLGKLDLNIREMVGDGNCLFRSISDQLTSSEHAHFNVREALCDFVEANQPDFEPFIEDDEPFDDYLERMRNDGEWGGNFELAAAVQCFGINIVVHNFQAPRYQLTCHDASKAVENVGGGTIHLSYHDGEHYNSCRVLGDHGRVGRAQATGSVKMLKDPSATSSTSPTSKGKTSILKTISRATECYDLEHIQDILKDCDNDHEACIECLIGELAAGAEWKTNELYKQKLEETVGSGGTVEVINVLCHESLEENVEVVNPSFADSGGSNEWSKVKGQKNKNKNKNKKLTKKEKKAEKRRQRMLQQQRTNKNNDEINIADDYGALVI